MVELGDSLIEEAPVHDLADTIVAVTDTNLDVPQIRTPTESKEMKDGQSSDDNDDNNDEDDDDMKSEMTKLTSRILWWIGDRSYLVMFVFGALLALTVYFTSLGTPLSFILVVWIVLQGVGFARVKRALFHGDACFEFFTAAHKIAIAVSSVAVIFLVQPRV